MGFIQTAVSVGVLVLSWRLYQNHMHSSEVIKVVSQAKAEYDYIVIGAGSAGSLVSARLTETPDITVLVLEAGPNFENIPILNQPEQWWKNIGGEFDWRYKTMPQKHACLGSKNNQCEWPRGRIVGGSGKDLPVGHNLQGHSQDSILTTLEYSLYKTFQWGTTYKTTTKSASERPWNTRYRRPSSGAQLTRPQPSQHVNDLGIPVIQDLPVGHNLQDHSQKTFQWGTTYKTTAKSASERTWNTRYRRPSSRAQLTRPQPSQHVSDLGIPVIEDLPVGHNLQDHSQKTFQWGTTYKATAKSASERPWNTRYRRPSSGAQLTRPQPSQHLNGLGIPVIQDLPVGHNLQDHSQVSMCTSIKVPYSMTSSYVDSTWNQLKYKLFNAGPKSMTASEGSAFLHLNQALENTTYPDVQCVYVSRLIGANIFDYSEDIAELVIEKDSERHGFCTFVALTHLRARGVISLSSTDLFDHPLIDPRYFENHQDVLDLVGGIRIWEKLAQSKTMSDLGVDINELNKRFCSEHKFRSDDYWECYIRKLAFTQFHPTSSCKMGALDDESTVVGPDLRVKGVAGLRVVDASVFPVITSGNTNTPTLMVAERAADFILDRKSV
ncbi:glucose dehydrogenase [FAD, quinone]-like [Mya arenaria]|uniref:glucose dehydrogenase [FAD, quinone]-like n=1 Tax=Mya arenaria TaxID=6604 RepID=UPI0022E8049C|nr:glucose dehydrogenase [FAD, quinone]-like [Mya arenaria]